MSRLVRVLAFTVAVVAQAQSGQTSARGQTPAKPTDSPPATAAKPAPKAKVPPPKPSLKDVEPKVLTAEEMAIRAKGASTFLSPTGEIPKYGEGVPFHELPAWRQTSFYGIRAEAQRVVYVVDCSESMADGACLIRAKRELRRSVEGLQFPQQFTVIFYNETPILMSGGMMRTVDTASKDALTSWLRLIEPDGGTDPRAAMRTAIGLKPDVIYLLSDGLFPDGTVEDITGRNKNKIPIHCIDLSGGLGGDQLKKIADGSGGQYAPRTR